AACFAKEHGDGRIDQAQPDQAAVWALGPFERSNGSQGPYQIQQKLQETMQDLVGIVRAESEMKRALQEIGGLRERANHVSVQGNREYNNGWHTALDLS